jgi:peptide deformylase
MAYRKVIKYPDNRLRKKSLPVTDYLDPVIQKLAEDLFDTLNVTGGVGISAPQIGTNLRVIAVKTDDFQELMINPVITSTENSRMMNEGCLSFPGIYENVERFETVDVEYVNLKGETINGIASGLPAQIVQHEIEHLDGKLIVDNVSSLKADRIKKRMAPKIEKLTSQEKKIGGKSKLAKLSKKELRIRRMRKKKNRNR